jgi:hypothetical protein
MARCADDLGMTTTSFSAGHLTEAPGAHAGQLDYDDGVHLENHGLCLDTVRRALAVGLNVTEIRNWACWMGPLDALEVCLAAGLHVDELRAIYAAKRLPSRDVLAHLATTRGSCAA